MTKAIDALDEQEFERAEINSESQHRAERPNFCPGNLMCFGYLLPELTTVATMGRIAASARERKQLGGADER